MTTRLPHFVVLSLLLHSAVLILQTPAARESIGDKPGLQMLPVSLMQPAAVTSRNDTDAINRRLPAQRSSTVSSATRASDIESAGSNTHTIAQPQVQAAGQQLQQALHRALLPHFHYPLLARAQGWQGAALFAVHVAADGHLSRLLLTRSSGYAVLDRAALDSLGKIRTLPEALNLGLDTQGMTLQIPVVYKLTEG